MEREKWIDSLKGMGVLLVVIGHTNSPFFKLIYGFHMPLFFVIAGFLYNVNKIYVVSFFDLVKKDAKRYLLPYILLSGCNLLISLGGGIIREGFTYSILNQLKKWIFGILWSYGAVSYLPNCTPLWFFVGLFFARLMMYFLMRMRSEGGRILACAGLALVDFVLSITNHIKLPWNIDAAMIGCVCMYFGYLLKKLLFAQKLCKNNRIAEVFIGISMVMIGFGCIMINGEVAVLPNRLSNPFLFWCGALFSSMGLIVVAESVQFSIVFLEKISHCTAFVMGFNYVLRDFYRMIWKKSGVVCAYPWFLEAILVVLSVCIMMMVWNRLKNRFVVLGRLGI